MSWVTEYSQDGQISYETMSESEPKFEKKLRQRQNQFFLVQILRDLSNFKKHDNEGTNLALWRPLVSLRNLTILAAKGEDKKSRKQLKQGSKKKLFFLLCFVNFPANMSYTSTLGSKRVYPISSTWGPKLSINRDHLMWLNNKVNKVGEMYKYYCRVT